MRDAAGDGADGSVAGLVLTDGEGRYYAIVGDELRRYRVPSVWVAALAAVVHGAEQAVSEDSRDGPGGAATPPAQTAFLHEAIGAAGGFRLAARRLDVWAVTDSGPVAHQIEAWLLLR